MGKSTISMAMFNSFLIVFCMFTRPGIWCMCFKIPYTNIHQQNDGESLSHFQTEPTITSIYLSHDISIMSCLCVIIPFLLFSSHYCFDGYPPVIKRGNVKSSIYR